MKTISRILIIFLSLITLSSVNADYKVYDNVEDFEKYQGEVCEFATDGCNNYFMTDGKVMGGTLKACPSDQKKMWRCTKYKEGVITTKVLPNNDERVYDNVEDFEKYEGKVCEFATDGCNNYFITDGKVMGGTLKACPSDQKNKWKCTKYKYVTLPEVINTDMIVNIVGGDKDEYGCIGSAGYEWSESKQKCIRPWEESNLSENDQSFYNSIKDRLDEKYQKIVDETIKIFDKKLSKYSSTKRNIIKAIMIEKIEAKISNMLMQYPQDIALPKEVNDKYLMYTLLKFELINL